MVRNDHKLPANPAFINKGDHRYDGSLEIFDSDGRPLIGRQKPAERSANTTFDRFLPGTIS